MSKVFLVKNEKKKLFHSRKILSSREILSLVESPVICDLKEEYLDLKLNQIPSLLCYIEGISTRPFKVEYLEKHHMYMISILTPSSIFDWQVALKFINDLSQHLQKNTLIPNIQDERIRYHNTNILKHDQNATTILEYDYKTAITEELKALFVNDSPTSFSYIPGLKRNTFITLESIQEILEKSDPVQSFSILMKETQYPDAFFSNVFYIEDKKDGTITGRYTLTDDVTTILPIKPEIAELTPKDISIKWTLSLNAVDENEDIPFDYNLSHSTTVPYDTFLKYLPEHKYRYFDAARIEVEAFSREELDDLAAKCTSYQQ